ncbi:MAG TPA: HAD family hydrolase [Thermomicrobiales bacterium]|nr:HAD family hydrolase [Thermomicrobiales bacterium]
METNVGGDNPSSEKDAPPTIPLDRQHLLFDADDTLWENNVHFERSVEEFVRFLDHEHLAPREIRAMLDEIELANVSTHGYGARAFAHSLSETFQQITGSNDEQALESVRAFGLRILDIEMEPIEGVQETLEALRPHHDLFLITKGDPEEQRLKIDRSAASQIFDAHVITQEKRTNTYRDIVESLKLDPLRTWMIGNSTRSDIHPALEAGLHAVLIPHPMTWHLEHVDIEHHPGWKGQFVELGSFRELLTLFRHSPSRSHGRMD